MRKAEHYILVNTRRRFVIEGGGPREEIPELPQDAVREVLFNAFAHRDRISRGVVQVDIYNDAVEITNPGWFIDGQDPEAHISGADRSSSSRNKLIVNTLYKSKDIEAYGTGIPRIRDACKAAGIEFEYRRVPIGTCFVFRRKDAFADIGTTTENADGSAVAVRDSSQKFAIVRDKFAKELSDTDLAVLKLIAENGSASSSDVMELAGVTKRGAQKILRRLVDRGIIESTGAARSTRYKLSE